ncbi:sorbosone dehydrogenase family protein [Salinibacterium sp. SWN1162]|uniref:PQQ-dependent sugar dehydrogenase n=1 Tax=Salinibacterium sp. SWN1162 TaxID=2792053 RepID=UPI0018CE1997|nr:PQQ-dependent sugar dehydrogenase [Salinibacterium sp. SWN1162]MBH0008397.1 PQQ-dependent sugar dehydrogenase [Salinibacterium sp. SWN1162]
MLLHQRALTPRSIPVPLMVLAPLVALALLAGCTQTPQSNPLPAATTDVPPRSLSSVTVDAEASTETIVTGLEAPWSMVRLESGSTLISERDTRLVKELTADGELREVGVIGDAAPNGEGGLLGLATLDGTTLYAYLTTATDNRILRFDLTGAAGSYTLGASTEILTDVQKSRVHNGGRIAFGPDGMLYATVGDASEPELAQDPNSLNGKILRMTPDGAVPADNPFPDSLVYSLGHRNPQGLAWDADGQLWASEFGQDTWDELNIITAGANYGWPTVEGGSDDDRFTQPATQWATDDASPSGLTYVQGTFFMAGLGGERLWEIYPIDTSSPEESFVDTFGRIRDVTPGPDGSLWMLTNNTDGRGDPREGDDRIVQVELAPIP